VIVVSGPNINQLCLKQGIPKPRIAAAAYACYWVGQYLVLTLNHTREFYADHFSAEVTRAPGDLSSALIKIAYGMVKADGEFQEKLKTSSEEKKRTRRAQQLGGAVSLLGIADLMSSQSLAIAVANPEQAAAEMRWDLVNPSSRFYQLGSTHPLTAFRVRAPNSDSEAMHQQVPYPLPGAQASDRKLQIEAIFGARMDVFRVPVGWSTNRKQS
jgi:Zn-dependent protease with chaperone function